MSFFYILYIVINKILKIYFGAETSRAEPGKGRNLLGPNRKRAENLWHSTSVHIFMLLNIRMDVANHIVDAYSYAPVLS